METKPFYLDAYFAGFFDADGHVGIRLGWGSSLYMLHVNVCNTDANVLLAFQERFGGHISGPRYRPRCKPVRNWVVDAQKAEAFIEAVLPFLIVKRERAELALEFRRLFKGEHVIPRGHARDTERNRLKRDRIIGARHDCYARMALLNKRGI